MELDRECGLYYALIRKVVKAKGGKEGKKKPARLRGHFITGNEMKGTGCNLIEAHTDIEPGGNCGGLCVEYNE